MTVLLCAPGAGRPDSGTTWDTRPALQFRSAPTSGQRAHRPRRAPTTPGRPLAETHAGLGTSRVRAARHAPPARAPPLSGRPPHSVSCLAPSLSAPGGTFSFRFRGISTFAMAVSDSKSASLRSFPGITQDKQNRPTAFVYRVERKKMPSFLFTPPSFRHFRQQSVSSGSGKCREAGAHVVVPEQLPLQVAGLTELAE